MKIIQIHRTDSTNSTHVDIPEEFLGKTKIKVTFEDYDEVAKSKLAEIQLMGSDDMVQNDIAGVMEDFKSIDSEI